MATDQYATAKPLLAGLPTWIADVTEQNRIAAYSLYEAIYWAVPETFKLISRGAEDRPIYVPAGKVIVETLHRYLANAVTFIADPLFGTPNDQTLATQVMMDLVRREKLYSKFNSNKRYGIMRGDWMWHLYADGEREVGSKLSIFAIDPSSVFPIYNPENIDEIIGYHVAEQVMIGDKAAISRLTYRKTTMKAGPSPITVEEAVYEVDNWGGPGMSEEEAKVLEVKRAPETLPAPIDQLPIYHIPNFQEPGVLYGSSEMRGLERILAAVNQSISDEELSLAMEGLGVYATDSGTPVDDDGNDVAWNLGPGRVVELPDGKSMNRVTGVSTVTPYQDHLAYLHAQIDQAVGIPGVAKGNVNVQVAESGVALMLELGPLLAVAIEKEQIVTDIMTNLLFDLAKWYVAYEGTSFNSLMEVTRWIPVYGEKVPENKAAAVKELLEIATAKVVPLSYIRARLRKLGYDDMPEETAMAAELATEAAATAQLETDVTGARLDQDINTELNGAGALAGQS